MIVRECTSPSVRAGVDAARSTLVELVKAVALGRFDDVGPGGRWLIRGPAQRMPTPSPTVAKGIPRLSSSIT